MASTLGTLIWRRSEGCGDELAHSQILVIRRPQGIGLSLPATTTLLFRRLLLQLSEMPVSSPKTHLENYREFCLRMHDQAAELMRDAGIEPTPANIVEFIRSADIPPLVVLAISIARL